MKVHYRYVQAVNRDGYVNTYYRRGGQRIKINGVPGDHEWVANYTAIHKSFSATRKDKSVIPGSMADLMIQYKQGPEYTELKPKTKKEYVRVMDFLGTVCAEKPAATLPRTFVVKLRNDNQDSPSRANKTIAFLKTLMNYAIFMGWRSDNPCNGVKKLKLGGGAKVWTAEDIQTFREKARPHHLLAFELGLNTGQRLGDVLTMPWSAYKDGCIHLVQQKTGKEMIIPCTARLIEVLENVPKESPVIVTNVKGFPNRRVDTYSGLFGQEIIRCGLSGISFHGLRKTCASILAEEGCTDLEIMSFTGHRTSAMVHHYTAQADQKRQAKKAVKRLGKRTKADKKCKTQRTKSVKQKQRPKKTL